MSRLGERLRRGWRGTQNRVGIVLAGIASFALAFLLGLHLFFPTTAVRQWLSGEIALRTPFSVQLAKMTLQPFLTLNGREVVVMYDNRPITIDELRLKPLWSSLVGGDPGVSLNAGLLQGRLDATLRRSGVINLQAAGLHLSELPVHPETRTLLTGTLVKGTLQGSFPARKGTETILSLQLEKCTLAVLGQPLTLGTITIRGKGQGNNLRLDTVTANDGEVAISGSGNLLLGTSTAASRINLDLTLKPAPSAPPSLAALLELATQRQADGSFRLKLGGSPGQLTTE